MDEESLDVAFKEGAGKWKGCDWPTEFGRTPLNLQGLKASQVLLLSRATAGTEAADWRAAVALLREIEADAQMAEQLAARAVKLAQRGLLQQALTEIQRACALEAKYHNQLVWGSLCDAVKRALSEVRAHHDEIGQSGRGQV